MIGRGSLQTIKSASEREARDTKGAKDVKHEILAAGIR
jgi:hypothetical protein